MGKVCNASGSDDDTAIEKTFTKGPWTEEEDDLLIAYVDKHGDGNWNAVQKHSGLSRCGKSCRLRWVNHLRPDLKKGAFTEKEEKLVIELHALLGNKWARMAGELPGRTDNEIKNFWNTRLKRLQRLGLPVYPDEVREQVRNAATQSGLNTDSLDAHHSQDSLEADCVEIPEFNFAQSSFNQCSSYYQSMLHNGRQRPCFVQPNMYNMIASPYMSTRKRSRESETAFPCTGGYVMNEQNPPLWNYPFVDNIPGLLLPDSHLLGNATYSSPPVPLIHEVQKLELPSFQYDNSPGSLGAQQSNPMSEHEPENTLVQSPLTTDHEPSDCPPSSLYDGLLESTVYGSSVEKRATDTDSESPLFQSSLLGHTELTPAHENTNGYVGSTSSNERPFDGDCIKSLLSEDRNNTELTPANEITESPLFQSSLLGHTELTPTNENTTGYVGSTSSNERPFDGDWIKILLGEDRNNTK